jgi:hypothetical protein
LWRVWFTPVPAIATEIENQMELLGLVPGQYVSTHLRALYGVETREDAIVQWWARNAVGCATTKLPVYGPSGTAMPILFVSDLTFATEVASTYAQSRGIEVVHRVHSPGKQPLHLEKANITDASEYYDAFVDVYMLGMSRCTAYNMGGYGKWGSRIGYNSSCVFFMKAVMERCDFTKKGRLVDPIPGEEFNKKGKLFEKPLFLPPMPETAANNIPKKEEYPKTTTEEKEVQSLKAVSTSDGSKDVNTPKAVSSTHESTKSQRSTYHNLTEIMLQDPLLYSKFDSNTSAGIYVWGHSKTLPYWMKKYFRWHHQQRRDFLNPQSWNDTSMRYLIMECLENHPKCGGSSDRLKPLPTLVRIAAVTHRILLIHWTRPAKLEEFLLPPKGGVDWRVPDWLRE